MGLAGSIKKDIRWRLADPMSLLMWIGIPLLIGGTMGLVFGGQGVKAKARLLVTDQDDTVITRFLTGAASGDLLEISKTDLVEGSRRIGEGQASAHLVIPRGFSDALLDQESATLRLVTNPSHRIWPRVFADALRLGVDAAFYLPRLGGEPLLQTIRSFRGGSGAVTALQVSSNARQLFERGERLGEFLDPLLLTVEDAQDPTPTAGEAGQAATRRSFNIGVLLFPGILFMSLMFIAQGITYDIWREKDLGTLTRLLCTPTGSGVFMLSKMITGLLFMALVAALGLLLGGIGFELPLAVLPGALVWITFAGASLLALFFFLQMLASSSKGANVLTSVVVFPLMMLGGSFIPYGSMPDGLQAIGAYTPNGLAVAQLGAILREEIDGAELWQAAAKLAGVSLVFFVLSVRLLRTRLAQR